MKKENFDDINDFPNPYVNKNSSEYIAVFGDIQYYTNSKYIKLFKRSINWIENVSGTLPILGVLHTGDIVQGNEDLSGWNYFYEATKEIPKNIPFISNIGNHDYSWEGIEINDRYKTHFSEYTNFPQVNSRIEAFFENGRMENIVVYNEIHGQRYDFLLLEFGPRKKVVEWANKWVLSHPDIKYILMNHEYLEKGGGRRVSGLTCKSQFKNLDYTTPEELWNQLIKINDNIVCVLCGHVGGLYAVTYEKNIYGRDVCQIQHNIQSPAYRYDNWLMMWEFPRNDAEAVVSIVNTKTGLLYESKDSLFTFKYKY